MSINFKSSNTNQYNLTIILNIIGSFFIKGGSIVVTLFTKPAYMRYFPDNKILGVWFVILSMLNLILYFDLGVGNGLRNKLPEILVKKDYKSAREYISSAYISIFIFVLAILLIFFTLESFIDWNVILNVPVNAIDRETLSTSMKIAVTGILFYFVSALIIPIFYAMQMAALNSLLSLLSSISILLYVLFAPRQSMEENLIALALANAVLTNLPYILASFILFLTKLRKAIPSVFCFSKKKAGEIFRIGLILLVLQIIFAVVSRTHELLISTLINPEAVVEYNAYNKIFGAIASIFILVLLPIWSAVTKAQVEQNYLWIRKVYKLLFLFVLATFLLNLAALPFLQFGMDIWLGENSIPVDMKYALIMGCFSTTIFILHSVNTTICNGLSQFRTQFIWMSVAALLAVPLSWIFCQITGDWIGVIIGCGLSMIPYELIQPFYSFRYLNIMEERKKKMKRILKNLEMRE